MPPGKVLILPTKPASYIQSRLDQLYGILLMGIYSLKLYLGARLGDGCLCVYMHVNCTVWAQTHSSISLSCQIHTRTLQPQACHQL